jgi:hypothetical protein
MNGCPMMDQILDGFVLILDTILMMSRHRSLIEGPERYQFGIFTVGIVLP